MFLKYSAIKFTRSKLTLIGAQQMLTLHMDLRHDMTDILIHFL